MSEAGYVELPVIKWLSGEGSTQPGDKGLGWTYRTEDAMAEFERPLENPLVEKVLIAAVMRINPEVTTEAQAKMAIGALHKAMSHPDKLTANRQTLDLLRDGATVEIVPGKPAKTVLFIEFDPAKQDLNDFTATNQYRIQGVRQCREDTVVLVNGIPLVIAEYKSYITSGKDWTEAVRQLHRYQRQAPLILAPNVFCVAADEDEFRYPPELSSCHDLFCDGVVHTVNLNLKFLLFVVLLIVTLIFLGSGLFGRCRWACGSPF